MNKELWYFLISGHADTETGLYGNFYAYGQHLGDALKNTFDAAKKENFNNLSLIEAAELDEFEAIEKREELVQLSETVYMRQNIFSFPLDDPNKEFEPPAGIVKSIEEDKYDYSLITENFVAYAQNEDGFFHLNWSLVKLT